MLCYLEYFLVLPQDIESEMIWSRLGGVWKQCNIYFINKLGLLGLLINTHYPFSYVHLSLLVRLLYQPIALTEYMLYRLSPEHLTFIILNSLCHRFRPLSFLKYCHFMEFPFSFTCLGHLCGVEMLSKDRVQIDAALKNISA